MSILGPVHRLVQIAVISTHLARTGRGWRALETLWRQGSHPARNTNIHFPIVHWAIIVQDVGFIEESVDFLADDGVFGDPAKLLELAGFEKEVNFRQEVRVANVSEELADQAQAGNVLLSESVG